MIAVNGAAFGAALFAMTPEDANDRQPLTERSLLFVGDIRIDNRDELLRALNDPRLGSASADSDIVLAAWLSWKHGTFARLVGSYAFALFDADEQRLILARGPLGDRPLCYRLGADELRFASMPSGIAEESGFSPDLAALARSMVHGDTALGETVFANVVAVPPAHYLEWSRDGHRLERFWQPPAVDYGYKGEVIEEFRQTFDDAVRSRLRRVGGPVATHLSSGLDSSGVAATAAALLQDRHDLIAFTMIPAPGLELRHSPQYRPDESDIASEAAQALNIEHRLVSHSGPLLDCLKGHGRTYQAPVPNVLNHGWGHAIDQQAAAAGAKVLLSATMGNATLSYGGMYLLSEWLLRGQIRDYARQLRLVVRRNHMRWPNAIGWSLMRQIPGFIINPLLGLSAQTARELFMSPDWKRRVEKDTTGSDYRRPGLRKDQYDMCAHTDPGLFIKGTLAKTGLDERDPGADQRLAEFCLKLPAQHYFHEGVGRRLARDGFADRLPASIVRNEVRGEQGADWFAKLSRQSALECIEEISASRFASEILDFQALRSAVADWDRLSQRAPGDLRQWGNRFTRALAVGSFLREMESDYSSLGRAS